MAIYDAPESLHVGNGVETVFGFNWPYLLPRDLIVTLNGLPVPTVLASPNQVAITPAAGAGVIVRIFRNTPAQNPTYLFATGIPMLPKYIDGNNKQLLYALQEGLLQFSQTQATADEALRRAAAAEIAAARAEEYAAQQARDIRRTVRVPTTDPEIPTLPSAGDRANKVLGFDSLGNPVGTLPASGSGTELALDLANKSDAGKGAGQIGFRGKWLSDYLTEQESYHTVEYFGPVDTPSNTRQTMQDAVNFCAANGVLLRARAAVYTLDVSTGGITIPDNFRCDFGGAWVRRATGNKTPHDMWINADTANGNTGLSIKGVRFDGRAQIDSLANAVAAHRFCGLRLIKCEGTLAGVRVDNTVNGEHQVEGIRGAIMLENSVFMQCVDVHVEGNIGTGLMVTGGRGSVTNLLARRNAGSGISGDQPYWQFTNLRNEVSGYSGISLNGPGWVANGLYSTGVASGFAGINFGHATPETALGRYAVATGVVAEDNVSWGINATSCPNLQGSGWVSRNSGDVGVRLTNCPGAKAQVTVIGGQSSGVLVDGAGTVSLDLDVRGSAASGVYARNGAEVTVGATSVITGTGSVGGFAAAVNADTNSYIRFLGIARANDTWGVQASGGATILMDGSMVTDNAGGDVRSASGGTVRYNAARFSADVMSGNITIMAGTTTNSASNRNTIDPSRIRLSPGNAAARVAGAPLINTITPQVSFTAQVAAAPASDAIYRYVLI